MHAADLAAIPLAAPGLIVRTAGDESLVHDPANGQVHVLNATAAWILQRCDGSASLAEIVDALALHSGVARERIARDVAAICATFRTRGLLS